MQPVKKPPAEKKEPPQDRELQISCVESAVADWSARNKEILMWRLLKLFKIDTIYNASMPLALDEFDVKDGKCTQDQLDESTRKKTFLDWIYVIFPEVTDIVTMDILEKSYEVFQLIAYRTIGRKMVLPKSDEDEPINYIFAVLHETMINHRWTSPQTRDDFFWKLIDTEDISPDELTITRINPKYYKCRYLKISFRYLVASIAYSRNDLDVFVLLDVLGYLDSESFWDNVVELKDDQIYHHDLVKGIVTKYLSIDKSTIDARRKEIEYAHDYSIPDEEVDPYDYRTPEDFDNINRLRNLKYHFLGLESS